MNKKFEKLAGHKFVYLPADANLVYEKLNEIYPLESEATKKRRKLIVDNHMLMLLSVDHPIVVNNLASFHEVNATEITLKEFLEYEGEEENVPKGLKPYDKIIVEAGEKYFCTMFSHYTQSGVVAINGYEYFEAHTFKDNQHLLNK